MALTRDFGETVQACAKRDPSFRKNLLRDAMAGLLCCASGSEPGPLHRRLHFLYRLVAEERLRFERCGSSKELQIHHIQPRSQLGRDVEEKRARTVLLVNAITEEER